MKLIPGLKFKLHGLEWTLAGFRGGQPLITCRETGQAQRITDKDLNRLIKMNIEHRRW